MTMKRYAAVAWVGACLTLAACDEATETADMAAAETAETPAVSSGRQIFQQRCGACHVASAEQNRVGPHLVGVFGRTAGAVDGFRYSTALAGSGIVWSDETLTSYLRDPRGYIPGNRMAFAGLARDADLEATLAYLRQATTPGN